MDTQHIKSTTTTKRKISECRVQFSRAGVETRQRGARSFGGFGLSGPDGQAGGIVATFDSNLRGKLHSKLYWYPIFRKHSLMALN